MLKLKSKFDVLIDIVILAAWKTSTVKLSKSAKLEKITFHPSILKNDDEKWTKKNYCGR